MKTLIIGYSDTTINQVDVKEINEDDLYKEIKSWALANNLVIDCLHYTVLNSVTSILVSVEHQK